MDKSKILKDLIEKKETEIYILELTEKHLQRKRVIEGSRYDMALGGVQGQLKEAKEFKIFLDSELEEL